MPIRYKSPDGVRMLERGGFSNEAELQALLAGSPDLFRAEDEPLLALVAREMELREAGPLDIFLVSEEGLPVAVEVKLEANGGSRREVVAQAVDYISALTTLTNDELDSLTSGRLSKALRSFEKDTSEELFERRWAAVGANLRAGYARMIIAVDAAPAGLERIVRFLAESSDLDIQLLAIERYASDVSGHVTVPRLIVSSRGSRRSGSAAQGQQDPWPDMLAAVAAYNAKASGDLQAVGSANYYRLVRPSSWPANLKVHYEFYRTSKYLGVELHLESDAARPLGDLLAKFAGVELLPGIPPLIWDQSWSSGRGRLASRLPIGTSPSVAAAAMVALIDRTAVSTGEALAALVGSTPP